jgi:hypothetical protein
VEKNVSADRLRPCDRRELIDDLWAMALEHLPALPAYEARVAQQSQLVGRDLEPWRAILAVALWLDDRGACGLAEIVERLAVAYQAERPGLEMGDLTALVIQGLGRCAVSAVGAVSAVKDEIPRELTFKTSAVVAAAKEVAQEMESDLDTETLTPRRVGRILQKMRWRSVRTNRAKGWVVNLPELHRWTEAYGLEWPQELITSLGATHPANGTNGTNGTTARGAQGASPEDAESLSYGAFEFEEGEI